MQMIGSRRPRGQQHASSGVQPAGSGNEDEWYILGCQMVKGCRMIDMRPDGRIEERSSLRPTSVKWP